MAFAVIEKATGRTIDVAADSITLVAPSIVRMNVGRDQIAGMVRQGNDLVVSLTDGSVIRIADFYVQANGTSSDLVIEDAGHQLWLAHPSAAGAERFTLLSDLTDVDGLAGLAATGGGGGGILLPALLGVAGAGALGVALAGGGGGGERAQGSADPAPDIDAPARPVATFGAQGDSVSGTGEAGATVQVRDAAGNVIGSGVVAANGSFTVPLSQPQTNGQPVSVIQTDAAGNASPAASVTAPDLTAPSAPTAAANAAGTAVTGTGEPGATVTIRGAGGQPLATATVDAQGNYTATLAPPQVAGATLSATQADAAGNVSAATAVTTPDLTAPDTPTATLNGDGTSVYGNGEPGATVRVTGAGGTVIGTATVAADGSYAAPLNAPQTGGGSLAVTQADGAGNVSPPATVAAPDRTPPDAPVVAIAAAGAVVTGTGEPFATVTVRDADGAVIGSGIVAADGSFTAPISPAQANGETLSVVQTDRGGNVSTPATLTVPDITAPVGLTAAIGLDGAIVGGRGEGGGTIVVRDAAGNPLVSTTVADDGSYTAILPTPLRNGETIGVTQADAAGNVSPSVTVTATDTTAPAAPGGTVAPDGASVAGLAEANANVTVRDAAGNPIGTATAGADGRYVVPLIPPLTDGEPLTIRQTDAAGNSSAPLALTAPDTTAPAGLTAAVSADGGIVTGSGEPAATVTVRDPGGTVVATTIVAADGTYTAILPAPYRNGEQLSVTQADGAGNAAAPVAAVAPDTTAPAAPAGTVADDGGSLSGTGEPGATVTVRDPAGTVIGTAPVGPDGRFTAVLTPAQTNGETLTLGQTDRAGNPSPTDTALAPDTTAPTGLVATINAAGTVVTGTAEAGATVTVRDPGGNPLGTSVVGANGAYAVVLSTPQTNGETLSVRQADPTGNLSTPAAVTAPDLTPPAAPTLTLDAGGANAGGTGEPGALLTITAGGTILATVRVAADGSYATPLVPAAANGGIVTATQADAAGNVSPPVSVTAPDVTRPDIPGAALDATGTIVSGIAEAGATVTVRGPGGDLGSTVADARGNYSVQLSSPQIDSQTLSVTQTDRANLTSDPATLIAPDQTPPAAPGGTVSPDGATLTGTGEPGATVTVTDPVGLAIGTALVDSNGDFIATLAPPQINGQALSVTQADIAGNVSAPAIVAAPDLIPNDTPAAPTAIIAADGASISGIGQAGAVVTVRDAAGVSLGTITADGAGAYTIPLAPPLLDGETVRVTQADAEGDVSPPTTAIAPDVTPPAAPVATIDATGRIVSGTGEAGATLRVTAADGTLLGTATVGANGLYVASLTTAQTNGQPLTVIQADAAGNPSPPAAVIAPDLTAPGPLTAAIAADGASVSGLGEPGATVTVRDAAGNAIGTATIAPDGSYTALLTPPQVNAERLTAVQADAVGNTSPIVPLVAPDATPPAAPTATVDATGTLVSGSGEAGATVTIRDPAGTPIGTATVAADGRYTAVLTVAQTNGQALTAIQSDAAGNASPPTPAAAPDFTAPVAPTGIVAGDGASVSGIGEPGATVTIRDPAGTAIGAALVAGDGRYTAALSTAQTNGQILGITQADPAGNISPRITATAPDTTAPTGLTATINAAGTIVSGLGEAGATVTVRDPAGTPIGTATVAGNGSYSVALASVQGNGQQLQVTQADAAGNAAPAVAVQAPDFTPPAAPGLVVAADGTGVTGLGEPGATVRITDAAGNVLATASVASDGSYAATLATPQANGQLVTATQADATGNVSPGTTVAAPDITPPAPPAGVAIDGGGRIVTGTGEPGATVEVRGTAGTVIGSGVVGAGGSFAVTLSAPQVAGEALSVSQRDPAGNTSGAVPLTAPFDIAAFDNVATASIDILPVQTNRDLGSAQYTALASLALLNVNAQVLATPNVAFTVQPGHRLDATFTYDATLNIGAAAGYAVVVQRFDGTNWVPVTTPGGGPLLELGLLGGNLVTTQALGPGEYRAFAAFDGALGVGLLGGLSVRGVDSDFTDVAGVTPAPVGGNVIADPGPGGLVDVVSTATVVQSVRVGGVTTAVNADGTIVDGQWGTLVINRDGSYTYTPDAIATAAGKTDSFVYTLRDPSDGELESATLTVRIGSPDVTGTAIAVNDTATATATFVHPVTTVPAALDASFRTATALVVNGPQTGSVTDSFTVAPGSTADVTLSAIRASGLTVLPSYTIVVTNAQGQEVGRISQTAVAGLPLGAGTALVLDDLPSGTYSYTVSSTNPLGTGYDTSVFVGQSVTSLTDWVRTGSTAAQGALLDNDTPGSPFIGVRILTGGSFVEVGETPLSITGAHGTLTVDEVGRYTYQPAASLAYAAADPIDQFTYQLVHPDGQVATARLDVAIDINNGVAPVALASLPEPPAMLLAHDDTVSLAGFATEPVAAAPMADVRLAFSVVEDQGSIDHFLAAWLDTGDGTTASAHPPAPATVDIAATPAYDDPLAYLAPSFEPDHDRLTQLHAV